jgi:hypothetical protein
MKLTSFQFVKLVGRSILPALAIAAVMCAAPAFAVTPYQFGFETAGTLNDWQNNDGTPAVPTPSGGGTLMLTAPQGNFYYEAPVIDKTPGNPSIGSAGFSLFGGGYSDPGAFTGNWYQSVSLYINPTGAGWANNPGGGFQVDGSPGVTSQALSNAGAEFNDEAQIVVTENANGHQVDLSTNISGVNGPIFGSITTPGWYTFDTSFGKSSGNPGDPITNNFGVFNTATGLPVGYTLGLHPASFTNSMLGQPFYGSWLVDQFPLSFGNGLIGVDNIQIQNGTFPIPSLTPEPSSIILFGMAFAGIGLAAHRRRRNA